MNKPLQVVKMIVFIVFVYVLCVFSIYFLFEIPTINDCLILLGISSYVGFCIGLITVSLVELFRSKRKRISDGSENVAFFLNSMDFGGIK
ncbi:hypothetical protein ACFLZN_00800 [Nanoarchaeota archaeon]